MVRAFPLPGWGDGESKDAAAAELARSAGRGRELARLLDPDTPAPGATDGTHCGQALATIAVPDTMHGRNHDRRGLRGDCRVGPFRLRVMP